MYENAKQPYPQQDYAMGIGQTSAPQVQTMKYGLQSAIGSLGKMLGEAVLLVEGISDHLGLSIPRDVQNQSQPPQTPDEQIKSMSRHSSEMVSRLTVIIDHLRS